MIEKISFDDWKNSMAFLIDDEFDNKFHHSIDELIKLMNSSSTIFSNEDALSEFLSKNENGFSPVVRLSAFVSLIGLSEERLKRVVSLLRYKFLKEAFKTEWDLNRISRTIISDEEFRRLLIDFFINGRNSDLGKSYPLYYLKNFRLTDPEFVKDLSNYNYVERILVDNEVKGTYANAIGAHIETLIERKLDEYKATKKPDLTFDKQKEFSLLNKNIDFVIPNIENPSILIEASYNITTGSGQSKRADQLVLHYQTLMGHNANHRKNKIILINYCDGFGWVGRQNDLEKIYVSSHFVLNNTNINDLFPILDLVYPA